MSCPPKSQMFSVSSPAGPVHDRDVTVMPCVDRTRFVEREAPQPPADLRLAHPAVAEYHQLASRISPAPASRSARWSRRRCRQSSTVIVRKNLGGNHLVRGWRTAEEHCIVWLATRIPRGRSASVHRFAVSARSVGRLISGERSATCVLEQLRNSSAESEESGERSATCVSEQSRDWSAESEESGERSAACVSSSSRGTGVRGARRAARGPRPAYWSSRGIGVRRARRARGPRPACRSRETGVRRARRAARGPRPAYGQSRDWSAESEESGERSATCVSEQLRDWSAGSEESGERSATCVLGAV